MATEVSLRLRFDRTVDIEELTAEVAAQQDCVVLDWDCDEDV